jgi:tRNA (guanine-N7-)-methyltransferase
MNPAAAPLPPPAPVVPGTSTLIHRLDSILARLDPGSLFPVSQPLEVEFGSGDGTFLVDYARLHPQRNFLGVERLLGRLRKLDRKGRRAGLGNLRGIRIEAAYLLEYLLPPASVIALHVYFPDPWPKRKHRKHRLVNEPFAESAARALALGGRVYLRTDDADYFAQMQAVFGANAGFQPIETPAELRSVLTDFEREFLAQGKPTLHAAHQRR